MQVPVGVPHLCTSIHAKMYTIHHHTIRFHYTCARLLGTLNGFSVPISLARSVGVHVAPE